jgi:hypothetical protein
MKRWRAMLLVLAATVLLASPPLWSWSGASGVHSVIALFQSHVHPDIPFDEFAAGRLGIIQATWRRTYLYVAYRYMAGPGFDAGEQKSLVSMWNETLGVQLSTEASQWRDANASIFDQTAVNVGEASAVWLAARNKIPGVYKADKVDVYRSAPLGLSFYSNCNDHAFLTAAHTLDTMVRMFGLSSSQVKNWLDAQDQVFDNCSDARPYFVSNPDAAPAAAPELPDRLKDGTPFERAQRTYQIACANFYSGNFDTAAKMFDAIAADTSSPWRQLAPYLVARATIRKATLSSEKNDHALLARAEAQLNNIVGTSDDDGVKHDARRLLGFVEAQLHPQEREEELARAVMLPTSGEVLEQDVSDYIWMLNNGPADNSLPGDDLTDWIATLAAFGQGNADTASLVAHSLEKWKATSSLAWLVAAISEIPAADPNTPALIESAEKVKLGSPAFATFTYHTARLLIGRGRTDEARAKLDAMLANRDELPRSTVNEIAALRMSVARNLEELLVDAPRTPLGITDDADSDELPSQLDDQGLKDLVAGPLFDTDGASALTRGLPLSVLMQAARSQTLPSRLRGQVALATFIRAILLGNLPAARELAPLVMKSFPQLQPSIDAWLAAQDPDAQRFAAAFMMLQNPGLRFYVDPGPGRTTALNQIDSLRDNWWPSRVGQNLTNQAYPAFLSASQKKSADGEWAEAVGDQRSEPALLRGDRAGQSRSERRACARGALSMPASRAPWMLERPGHCACPLGVCSAAPPLFQERLGRDRQPLV